MMSAAFAVEALLVVATGAATILLGLVMWAFRRHALSTEDSVLTDLVAGIFWLATAIALRGLWWDAAPWVLGQELMRSTYLGSNWPNILFDVIVAMAALRLLRGFLLMIPDEDRKHYNILTAALYPRRVYLKLTAQRKGPRQ